MKTLRRFLNLWRRAKINEDIDAEMRSHLEMRIEENLAAGMPEAEARRDARLRFGNPAAMRERTLHADAALALDSLWRDLRYGLRSLIHSPGFTVTAILTLTIGIGGVVAVFSVVDAVLLRPLPFQSPARIVSLHEGIAHIMAPAELPAPDVIRIARENRSFAEVAGFADAQYEVNGVGAPFEARAERVTASLFPLLGTHPLSGRVFTQNEDAGSIPVAVISYALWHGRFRASRAVIGQTIDLNRRPYTIIGVMPRNFEFPLTAGRLNRQDMWVPMSYTPKEKQDETDDFQYGAIARLKPGVTLIQARLDVNRIMAEIQKEIPPRFGIHLTSRVDPLSQEVTNQAKPLLHILSAAVLLILLIGCVNLANLLLIRAVGRRREFGMRVALGAGRWAVIRQLCTESLILSAVGGMAGVGLAALMVWVVRVKMPDALPRLNSLSLNWPAMCFALVITAATAVACGLAPAWATAKANVLDTLREGGQATGIGRSQHRLRALLVVTEVTLAMVLLTGSALLLRSFGKMLATDPGFQPEHVLTASLSLPAGSYPVQSEIDAFYRRLLRRLGALPGIRFAGASSNIPIIGSNSDRSFIPVGYASAHGHPWCSASNYFVMGNYLRTMQIPLVEGRYFMPADEQPDAPLVAIVSQTAAREYWPGENPIGRQFRMGGDPNSARPLITVVGVVGDVHQGPLDHAVYPQMYEPFTQFQRQYEPQFQRFIGVYGSMDIALRTIKDPSVLAVSVVKAVHRLDPQLAVSRIHTMDAVVASAEASRRFSTALLTAFAGIALALALLGIYGVLAYIVTARQREIAIRIAVGATRQMMVMATLRSALALAATGVLCGLGVAAGLTRFMMSLLYHVKPLDIVSMIGATATLLLCAACAGMIPAWRASRIDPMQALRSE